MAWGETGLSILLRALNLLVLSYYPLLHVAPINNVWPFSITPSLVAQALGHLSMVWVTWVRSSRIISARPGNQKGRAMCSLSGVCVCVCPSLAPRLLQNLPSILE